MNYAVLKGKIPHCARPSKRTKLDDLIALAKEMETGDAAVMSSADAQTFRTILNTLGFDCVTEGYRCETRGKTLAFKIQRL